MDSKNITYIPAVDQLRGMAALWITLYHSVHLIDYQIRFGRPLAFDYWPTTNNPLWAMVLEGHSAVSLFMVLSGFILTLGAWGRQLNYRQFITNRIIRIYPLAIFLVVVAAYSAPQSTTWSAIWQTLLLGHNLPGSLANAPYTDMFWAISVEFQFYLVFPFLCYLMQKDKSYLGLKLILCLLVFRWIAYLNGANVRDLGYFTVVGRLDQFLIGMMLAGYWRERKEKAKPNLPMLVVSVGVFGLALLAFNKNGGWPSIAAWKVFWPLVEGAICAAFIYFYIASADLVPKMIAATFQRIGEISYSLYLTHMIVLVLVCEKGWLIAANEEMDTRVVDNTLILVLPLAWLLATVTHQAIEQPFLQLRRRYLSEDEPTK